MRAPPHADRLRILLERCPRRSLVLVGRAAGVPTARGTRLIDALCTLPRQSVQSAFATAMARRDLQALCERSGYATTGSASELARRIVAGTEPERRWRPFVGARTFAQSLQLSSQREWWAVAPSGRLPADVPKAPHLVYAAAGWTSWGDFLGTGNPARHLIAYRDFHAARDLARSLGLPDVAAWRVFCKTRSGNRRLLPPDIPSAPHRVYADRGWTSYGDWLGTGRIGSRKYRYRSYSAARAFVREVGIPSEPEWRAYCRGERSPGRPRPSDIPSNPSRVYRGRGWISWGEFTGVGSVAVYKRKFLSFAGARTYVRSQGLRTSKEWRTWCRSGKRPADVPGAPDQLYRGKGWVSWGDFLGGEPRRLSARGRGAAVK